MLTVGYCMQSVIPPPARVQLYNTSVKEVWTISVLKAEEVEPSHFSKLQTCKNVILYRCLMLQLYFFFFLIHFCSVNITSSKNVFLWRNLTVLFVKKHSFLPAPAAPDTPERPLGSLPQPGSLGLGWVWAEAGLNYPRATGQSQQDPHCQGTLSSNIRDQNGPKNQKVTDQGAVLTHLPSTLPRCLLSPSSLLPSELLSVFSCDPPTSTHTHTHTHPLPPLFVVTWSWWTIFQIDFKNVHKQPIP